MGFGRQPTGRRPTPLSDLITCPEYLEGHVKLGTHPNNNEDVCRRFSRFLSSIGRLRTRVTTDTVVAHPNN